MTLTIWEFTFSNRRPATISIFDTFSKSLRQLYADNGTNDNENAEKIFGKRKSRMESVMERIDYLRELVIDVLWTVAYTRK